MAHFFAALALAGVLIPLTPAPTTAPATQVAQMARDVTDAIRKQRAERRERSDATNHAASGKKR
jgi:hypothetical protein